jgi:hypothetical protein
MLCVFDFLIVWLISMNFDMNVVLLEVTSTSFF